ncbi:MAG TPA: AraC family transcriptional regulator [Bacillaceae bacterium]|nr:AraC family transcriptional regulator [Paenibacillus bovis]HLU22376.1 AraC family transcriptional regulator [Bacillaceae bacterium]
MTTKQVIELSKDFSFPFKISIYKNKGNWKMPFEWHEFLEIFYVLDGSGNYFIENKLYKFNKGDLFVIGKNELHKSQLVDDKGFDAVVIIFDHSFIQNGYSNSADDLLSPFFHRPSDFSHQLHTDKELKEKLEHSFQHLLKEYENQDDYTLSAISSLLQWLLIELKRAYGKSDDSALKHHSRKKLKPIVSMALDYINQFYFHEDITLEKIAQQVGVSTTYLSSEFKKNTGFSIIEFITNKRVQMAIEHLLMSNLAIIDIAYKVGYKNVTHFNLVFKKLVGVSPSNYRKQHVNKQQRMESFHESSNKK